ncbi:MAG: hypothetical protein EA412_04995 [Chitinophagaceae bacterium]|nr:MAG: hypothetical protein EA412_04995 [Chitinophagaceae bacterium]
MKIFKYNFLIIALMIFQNQVFAQQEGVSINEDGAIPHESAILDIKSDNRGFLPPRMTEAQRNMISAPARGLVIFNTTTNCTNIYSSSGWYEICGDCTPLPPDADAGPNQQYVPGTSFTLDGNNPGSGFTGTWSVPWSFGNPFSFDDVNDPNTVFYGEPGTSYSLQWEISNACGSTTDFVTISFDYDTNVVCGGAIVSTTPCSDVPGAVLNDDPSTPLGIEYDWADATSDVHGVGFGATTGTRALVEIAGQCWARFNSNIFPTDSAFASPSDHDLGSDVGWHGYWDYSTTENFPNEGRLYQWSAAMNGETTEKAQGVCPDGWHIPTDCEWMYLEDALGMSIGHQIQENNWRHSGEVGLKLSDDSPNGLNSTGFTALMTGFRLTVGCGSTFPCNMADQNTTRYWTSTENPSNSNQAVRRGLHQGTTLQDAVYRRVGETKGHGLSVRCLKD